MISTQEFRNRYEEFYNCIRLYLWPYSTLETLAEVEATIYSAFIDIPKLESGLVKLESEIKQMFDEDPLLVKSFNKLKDLTEEANEPDNLFMPLSQVKEVNPDENKQIRIFQEEDNSEEQ